MWSNIIPGVSVRVFGGDSNIETSRPSKAEGPPNVGGPRPSAEGLNRTKRLTPFPRTL